MKVCVLCLKKPLLYSNAFTGIIPYHFKCTHLPKKIEIQFEISYSKIFFSTVLLALRVLAYMASFQIYKEKWNTMTHTETYIVIVHSSGTILCFIYQLCQYQASFTKVEAYQRIINATNCLNNQILSKKRYKSLSRLCLIHTAYQFCELACCALVFFGMYSFEEVYYRPILYLTEDYAYIFSCMEAVMDVWVYCYLFDEVYERIQLLYEARLKGDTKNLAKSLPMLLFYYERLIRAFHLVSSYTTPMMVAGTLSVVAIQVCIISNLAMALIGRIEFELTLENMMVNWLIYSKVVVAFIAAFRIQLLHYRVNSMINSLIYNFLIRIIIRLLQKILV